MMVSILRSLLKQYWRDARRTTIMVVAATIVGALAAIAAPYLLSRASDVLATGTEQEGALRLLLLYTLLFGIAAAVSQGARFLICLCSEQFSFVANSAFFARLLRKTLVFFHDHTPSRSRAHGSKVP